MKITEINKKIDLDLTTLDGNAFALMGGFQRQARREGWTPEEIKTVINEAQTDDYDHIVQTLMAYCN